MTDDKLKRSTTTDGKPPREGYETAAAPAPVKANGQHEAYWVLNDEERRKGFVRPVRDRYTHVGIRPVHPTRDLTLEELNCYAAFAYVAFETYPDSEAPATGRFWTRAQLNGGCGQVTIMSRSLAETYAVEPGYYGATFCSTCGRHIPVEEFTWLDGTRVGS